MEAFDYDQSARVVEFPGVVLAMLGVWEIVKGLRADETRFTTLVAQTPSSRQAWVARQYNRQRERYATVGCYDTSCGLGVTRRDSE